MRKASEGVCGSSELARGRVVGPLERPRDASVRKDPVNAWGRDWIHRGCEDNRRHSEALAPRVVTERLLDEESSCSPFLHEAAAEETAVPCLDEKAWLERVVTTSEIHESREK